MASSILKTNRRAATRPRLKSEMIRVSSSSICRREPMKRSHLELCSARCRKAVHMRARIIFLSLLLTVNGPVGKLEAAQANGCGLGGAAIAFGAYDPTSGTALDTAGSLIYRCTQKDHNIIITLSQGGGTSYGTRQMVNGSNQLLYNLYLDAGRTIIWG